MNAINYDRLMMQETARPGERRLLIHACCAPCSSACLERLKDLRGGQGAGTRAGGRKEMRSLFQAEAGKDRRNGKARGLRLFLHNADFKPAEKRGAYKPHRRRTFRKIRRKMAVLRFQKTRGLSRKPAPFERVLPLQTKLLRVYLFGAKT